MRARAAAVSLALLAASCSTYRADKPETVYPRTLWAVCWDGDGQMLLPSDLPPHEPQCSDPAPIRWPRAQIRISTLQEHPSLDKHLAAAIAQWNLWLGWDMFVATDLGYDVLVVYLPPHWLYLGMAHLEIEAGVMVGGVALYGYYPEHAHKTLLHELGHILGLAHEIDEGWLMTQGGGSTQVQREDLLAIRRLYGR